jgi:hypothetical protein
MDIAAQLISSNSKRFGSSESVMRELGQLSDLSKDEESFKLGARAVTRMYASSQVDAKHLQEFAADTGYNLTSAERPGSQNGLQSNPGALFFACASREL